MKRTLFYLGALLTIASFFLRYGDEFSFVRKTITPSYVKFQQADATYSSKRYLSSNDAGYKEFTYVISELANDPEKVRAIGFHSITQGIKGIVFTPGDVRQGERIVFRLSDGMRQEIWKDAFD